MVFSAVTQLLMYQFLGYCQAKYPNSDAYSTLVANILGKKWGYVLFLLVTLFNFGVIISYSIVSKISYKFLVNGFFMETIG